MESTAVRKLVAGLLLFVAGCGDGSSSAVGGVRYRLVEAEQLTSFTFDKGSRLISSTRLVGLPTWAPLSGTFEVVPLENPPADARFAFEVTALNLSTPVIGGEASIVGSEGEIIGRIDPGRLLDGQVRVEYFGRTVDLEVEAFLTDGIDAAFSNDLPPTFLGLALVGSVTEVTSVTLFIRAEPEER